MVTVEEVLARPIRDLPETADRIDKAAVINAIKAERVAEVPDGWYVVNPRRMAELKAAENAVGRARDLADEWASEPYAEEFQSTLAGVLIDVLNGGSHD